MLLVSILIGVPVLLLATMIQAGIVSQVWLLHGHGDVVLLVLTSWVIQPRVRTGWWWWSFAVVFTSVYSALPIVVNIVGYGIAVLIGQLLNRRSWQFPLLVYLFLVVIGSLGFHAMTILTLNLGGEGIGWMEPFTQTTIPSLIMNLLLSIPIFILIGDISKRLFPPMVEP